MELEAVIGLEIHVQLKTASKMFCSCANIFGTVEPNSAVCPICMGYPGTLPVPNGTAIEWTQRAGAALNCELAADSKFDRKSYFYPDLPKAYQISQLDQPFCGEGGLDIIVGGERVRVEIERIHLEEDAAKNTHSEDSSYTLIDYNRAGTPLMEIVTKPDLRSPEAAKVFLQELQRIMRALGISDADMEKGQMRCDANISLREPSSTHLHPKTEIKNINSFRFVAKGLEYEIERQTKLWEASGPPQEQSTRGYDAKTGTTIAQRTKEEVADYRYFPEPDIPSFSFSKQQLAAARAGLPELPLQHRTRLMRQYGINDQQAQLLVDNPDLAGFFENTVSEIEQLDQDEVGITATEVKKLVKKAGNMILREVRQVTDGVPVDEWKVSAANFAELVVLVFKGVVNQSAVGQVVAQMQETGGDPDHIIDNLGLAQVSGDDELTKHVQDVIDANPEVVEKVKAGKESAIQYLLGQVMARTKGAANPGEAIKLIQQLIND
ncbi:Asp-tRNA(Asn)/Glu-tRNA(Gln) amidotransferase GatCAB subunit B [bacterium]|nr:Asp-tRNA(Asn)/Glu-tRNA(Gln) amidotransferase GatCAB subunit B [bacterium]